MHAAALGGIDVPDGAAVHATSSMTLALIVLAYLCGSIPTGVLVSRRRGVDPRDIGSGNIGATNVARAAGRSAGLVTLAGDAAKGLLPVLLASRAGVSQPALALVGFAAFIGHLYSCFLGFEGGKGVATALGVFLGLAPLGTAILIVIFLFVLALTRYVSLASIVAASISAPLLLALGYPRFTVAVALLVGVLVTFRHRDNIRRLRFRTEPRVGVVKSSRADSGVA